MWDQPISAWLHGSVLLSNGNFEIMIHTKDFSICSSAMLHILVLILVFSFSSNKLSYHSHVVTNKCGDCPFLEFTYSCHGLVLVCSAMVEYLFITDECLSTSQLLVEINGICNLGHAVGCFDNETICLISLKRFAATFWYTHWRIGITPRKLGFPSESWRTPFISGS